jgi:hypothetical protein
MSCKPGPHAPSFSDLRAIWQAADLSPGARLALLELTTYLDYQTGQLGRGPRARICAQLGYSERQASNLLQELKRTGYVRGRRLIIPQTVQDSAQVQNSAHVQDSAQFDEQGSAHEMSNNVHTKCAVSFPPYQHSPTSTNSRETVEQTERVGGAIYSPAKNGEEYTACNSGETVVPANSDSPPHDWDWWSSTPTPGRANNSGLTAHPPEQSAKQNILLEPPQPEQPSTPYFESLSSSIEAYHQQFRGESNE